MTAATTTPTAPFVRARAPRLRRPVVVAVSLTVALVGTVVVSLCVGTFPIAPGDVLTALVGGGPADRVFVVRTLRLPRALTGVLVGAASGLSGGVLQTVLHNPLATPDFLGITAGASAGAVAAIVVLGATGSMVSGAAVVGALAAVLAIHVAAGGRHASVHQLVLAGIGVAAVLVSVVSLLLVRADLRDAQQAIVWLTGSLNGRSWSHVKPLALSLALLVPATLAGAPALRQLSLGDDVARASGVAVDRARPVLVLLAVGCAAVATAATGPVAFVAFVSAPVAQRLTRADTALVPAALVGALLVSAADLVARTALAPTELPVGVVTALVGAPYLVWLLVRTGAGRRSTS